MDTGSKEIAMAKPHFLPRVCGQGAWVRLVLSANPTLKGNRMWSEQRGKNTYFKKVNKILSPKKYKHFFPESLYECISFISRPSVREYRQPGQSCASLNIWGTSYFIVFMNQKKSFKMVAPACLE